LKKNIYSLNQWINSIDTVFGITKNRHYQHIWTGAVHILRNWKKYFFIPPPPLVTNLPWKKIFYSVWIATNFQTPTPLKSRTHMVWHNILLFSVIIANEHLFRFVAVISNNFSLSAYFPFFPRWFGNEISIYFLYFPFRLKIAPNRTIRLCYMCWL